VTAAVLLATWVVSSLTSVIAASRLMRWRREKWFTPFVTSWAATLPGCALLAEVSLRRCLSAVFGVRRLPLYDHSAVIPALLWALVGPILFAVALKEISVIPSSVRWVQFTHLTCWATGVLVSLWFAIGV
jgi:hypothetical protein